MALASGIVFYLSVISAGSRLYTVGGKPTESDDGDRGGDVDKGMLLQKKRRGAYYKNDRRPCRAPDPS